MCGLTKMPRAPCPLLFFFFSSRRRHTRLQGDWISDVCSSDLPESGVLYVKDTRPFHYWHEENYAYSNGEKANVRALGASYSGNTGGPFPEEVGPDCNEVE